VTRGEKGEKVFGKIVGEWKKGKRTGSTYMENFYCHVTRGEKRLD